MTTYLFPGQGSQYKGMGEKLFDEFTDYTNKASNILGYSIKELCLNNPDGCLNKTEFTQPAIYIVNALSYYKKMQENSNTINYYLGHSLGEYNALLAANVFNFETGLQLVKKRGEVMAKNDVGAMAAVIGLDEHKLTDVLRVNNLSSINIANYNTHTQLVISGTQYELSDAYKIFSKISDIMFIPLNVSGAFHHHDIMLPARNEFSQFINQFSFNAPTAPVIANINAQPYVTSEIKYSLINQINHSVRWVDSIKYVLTQGETDFLEIGPGNVLTKLLKQIIN